MKLPWNYYCQASALNIVRNQLLRMRYSCVNRYCKLHYLQIPISDHRQHDIILC